MTDPLYKPMPSIVKGDALIIESGHVNIAIENSCRCEPRVAASSAASGIVNVKKEAIARIMREGSPIWDKQTYL